MSATISDLHATRNPDMLRTMTGNRDYDGNILDDETCDVPTYTYPTSSIPSYRIENLLKVIIVDSNQGLLVYHQLIQGIVLTKNNFIKKILIIYSLSQRFMPLHGSYGWLDG